MRQREKKSKIDGIPKINALRYDTRFDNTIYYLRYTIHRYAKRSIVRQQEHTMI